MIYGDFFIAESYRPTCLALLGLIAKFKISFQEKYFACKDSKKTETN